jgi:hypothetical protein
LPFLSLLVMIATVVTNSVFSSSRVSLSIIISNYLQKMVLKHNLATAVV